jgi:peptidoglycan hydrolase-like protein with peptidoglycan-binding domain
MEKNEVYEELIQSKGPAYREEQIKVGKTHYKDPIDRSPGRLAGNSRISGDASPEVQSRAIDALIEASQRAGLSPRDIAHVLAIARAESGFNPDAAAGTTFAFGLGQFVRDTGKSLGITPENRGDVTKQAEALVQYFKSNAAQARHKGQGEDYVYKYHHDGPGSGDGGEGLELSRRNVMPYIPRFEKFVAEYEKKYGVLPVDPAFAARTHSVAGHGQTLHAGGSLAQGSRGEAVGELQAHLNELGYRDANSHPLKTDKNFGVATHAAVIAFQGDHGLEQDGKVGPATAKALGRAMKDLAKAPDRGLADHHPVADQGRALAHPARLDDAAHPDNALFRQAQTQVHALDQQQGRTPDYGSDNLASALAVEARAQGLQRIDQVRLSDDASKVWAIQKPPGVPDTKYASVGTTDARTTPMEQSGAQWLQATQQAAPAQRQALQQAPSPAMML